MPQLAMADSVAEAQQEFVCVSYAADLLHLEAVVSVALH